MDSYSLAAFLFFIIGVVLSLLGSGGAILTIPVLVYVLNINPYWATSYSMFIMGISNWAATVDNIKKQTIHYKIGLYFAVPGLLVTFFIRRLILPRVPNIIFENAEITLSKGNVIMLLFSVLILFTAIKTLKGRTRALKSVRVRSISSSAFLGAAIGLVTGFVGAGGGFLIVPALYLKANISMREAIATSLFIIAITTTIGFLGDFNPSVERDWKLLLFCMMFSVSGVVVASAVKNTFTNESLRLIFGYFILGLGILVLFIELNKLGISKLF